MSGAGPGDVPHGARSGDGAGSEDVPHGAGQVHRDRTSRPGSGGIYYVEVSGEGALEAVRDWEHAVLHPTALNLEELKEYVNTMVEHGNYTSAEDASKAKEDMLAAFLQACNKKQRKTSKGVWEDAWEVPFVS